MFYDIENPNQFCKDINELLNKDGIWVSEFSYFPLLLKNLTYDQICHEHCVYYSLTTFKNIIEKTTTIIGVDAHILWASARLRYLKARTNKPDSTIDNILLSICIFQL